MSLIMNKFKCTSADLYTYIKLLRGKYKRNIRYILIQEMFIEEKKTRSKAQSTVYATI